MEREPENEGISVEELQLATRNHGMPLEALRYPVTPIGLHYLLIHFDIPLIDPELWRLRIDGLVRTPLELTLEQLRAMPSTRRRITMECAGNGRALLDPRPRSQPWLVEAVGTGEWTGVELDDVLSLAGIEAGAVEVLFSGDDRGVDGGVEQRYQRSLGLDEASASGALLAYELNGSPLPPQHGFPLRLIVPCWYGMTNVKWLSEVTVLGAPFDGYQQTSAYRLRHNEADAGVPVTRIAPRSLMVPPGIPDFFSRSRLVGAGPVMLTGRAWSGFAKITMVEVSVDGGSSWNPADLDPTPTSAGEWQGWTYRWDARPGSHELCSRALDAEGNRQPLQPEWNLGGYINNSVQRVRVDVSLS